MRFLSRSAWQIGALAISVSLLNACSSGGSDDAESIDPVAPEVEAEQEAAAPPPAASAPAPVQQEQITTPLDGPAPTTPPAFSGSATRRVLYVKANGTPVREKANSKATVLSKLKRGDHLLVNIEGDWARLDQGGYIAMKALSEKGIAPPKKPVRWKGGRAGAVKPAKPNPRAPVKADPVKQDVKSAAPVDATPPPPSADSPAGAGVAPDVGSPDDVPSAGDE